MTGIKFAAAPYECAVVIFVDNWDRNISSWIKSSIQSADVKSGTGTGAVVVAVVTPWLLLLLLLLLLIPLPLPLPKPWCAASNQFARHVLRSAGTGTRSGGTNMTCTWLQLTCTWLDLQCNAMQCNVLNDQQSLTATTTKGGGTTVSTSKKASCVYTAGWLAGWLWSIKENLVDRLMWCDTIRCNAIW